MSNVYYDTIDKMEKEHVNREYVTGWATGFLRSPKVEEQRITDAYDAGYQDGMDQKVDGFSSWTGAKN